jgi:hypothetical protein
MIICQVDARITGLAMEDVDEELRLLGEVLAALDGELIGAVVYREQQSLVAYVRAESELAVSDIFDATHFAAERIAYLGPGAEAGLDFNRLLGRAPAAVAEPA